MYYLTQKQHPRCTFMSYLRKVYRCIFFLILQVELIHVLDIHYSYPSQKKVSNMLYVVFAWFYDILFGNVHKMYMYMKIYLFLFQEVIRA